jgi:hypothetical protein
LGASWAADDRPGVFFAADGAVPSPTKEDTMKSTCIIFAIVVFGAALLVGTAAAQLTPLGLKAYGERLQAEARMYQQQQGPTALGLKAWGERLQAEARIYQQQQQPPQKGPTALGLKAWGERLQAEARMYRQQGSSTVQSTASHFDWGDAVIGALVGFTLAVGCAGAFLVGRRFRRTQFAAF